MAAIIVRDNEVVITIQQAYLLQPGRADFSQLLIECPFIDPVTGRNQQAAPVDDIFTQCRSLRTREFTDVQQRHHIALAHRCRAELSRINRLEGERRRVSTTYRQTKPMALIVKPVIRSLAVDQQNIDLGQNINSEIVGIVICEIVTRDPDFTDVVSLCLKIYGKGHHLLRPVSKVDRSAIYHLPVQAQADLSVLKILCPSGADSS